MEFERNDPVSTGHVIARVLVPTDFSDGAEKALTVAIRFARLLRAAIDLIHVYPLPAAVTASPIPGVPFPAPTPEILQDIQQKLEALATRVRESGLDCLPSSGEGKAADEIVARANKIDAALIVMGTHGRTGLKRVLLGSVAEQVLHKATCPVLVVPIREPSGG